MANLGAVEDDILDEGGVSDPENLDDNPPADPPADDTPPDPPKDEDQDTPPPEPPVKDENDDNPAKDAPKGYVPHAALHQQREINKELQAALDQANQRLGAVDSLKEQLDELRKAGKTSDNEDPAPDKEKDPMAYLEWENRQLKRDVDAIKNQHTQAEETSKQTEAQQKQMQEFMTEVGNQVSDFIGSQPDYPAAFEYAMERRMAEYEAMGVKNAQQKAMMFDREVMQVANTALTNRVNPGQAMYDIAKSWGYKPEQKKDSDDDKGDKDDKTLQDHLDRLEKGSKARSMGGAGGEPPSDPTDVAAALELPDAEFDAWWDKTFGKNSII